MFSKTFLALTLATIVAAALLSDVQMVSGMAPKLPDMTDGDMPEQPKDDSTTFTEDVKMDSDGRLFFGNLFNLSAALASAPTNTSALGFVPLGSLLFGSGKG